MRPVEQYSNKREISTKMLITAFYLPTLFVFIGRGVFIPFLPIYARTLGVSIGTAGFTAGIMSLSAFLFDLPGGMIIEALGERRSVILSTAGIALTVSLAGILRSIMALIVLLLIYGALQSVLMVALMSFMRSSTKKGSRGRKISSLGGLLRFGRFLGPIAGGFIAEYLGYSAVFFSASALTFISVLLLIFSLPEISRTRESAVSSFSIKTVIFEFKRDKRIFVTIGIVMVFLSLIRKARQIVIPLWGSGIGIETSKIGLIIGIASAFEMLMFIPAGFVMDKLGRKYALGLCMLLLSAGLAILPLSRDTALFFIFSILIGIGNGFGSGINMTFGSDLAGRGNVGVFLGLWRQISDFGSIGAPLGLGLITDSASLPVSIVIFAGVGFIGFIYMLASVKETLQKKTI